LIFTDQLLSTAHVYREFDNQKAAEEAAAFAARAAGAEAQWRGVRTVGDVAGLLRNDLEDISCNLLPGLCDAKDILLQEGALGALMSGSGPTVYGLCASREDALALCEKVSADGVNCRVTRSLPGA